MKRIEEIANGHNSQNVEVKTEVCALEDALKTGATPSLMKIRRDPCAS